MFAQYGRSLLWAITAAVGFGLGVGISLKVFDWLSSDIDEWEEIIPDAEYGIFVMAILNNVKRELIIDKILDSILNTDESNFRGPATENNNIKRHPFC